MITSKNIKVVLNEYVDINFREFTSRLIPSSRPILGVRVPILRKIAKEIAKGEWKEYLKTGTEDTYEEVAIKGFVIGYVKEEMEILISFIKEHIEKIDDWSLCDGFCSNLKIVEKYRAEFWTMFMSYVQKNEEFKQRIVAVMLMNYFLTDEYIDRSLEILDSLKNEQYYCKMAVAWAIATAWVKQREKILVYMQEGNNALDDWTYNKAIQKMLESYRVSDEDKKMLREMKRK